MDDKELARLARGRFTAKVALEAAETAFQVTKQRHVDEMQAASDAVAAARDAFGRAGSAFEAAESEVLADLAAVIEPQIDRSLRDIEAQDIARRYEVPPLPGCRRG